MSITEADARETPADDDEISVLYAKQNSDNKGKAKTVEIDDDEIQLLFATNWNRRNKKRKAFVKDDHELVILFEEEEEVKKKLMVDLNNIIHLDDDDDDDEVQVISSFPAQCSNSMYNTVDLSMLVMCEICADEKPRRDFVTVMGCDHFYCSECVASYVASKLQQNVVEITCPVSGCEGVLGPEHCRSVLPSQVYERWGRALCEEVICPSQKFYCPYKDCSALMIDETRETGEFITQMACPNCQRLFCVKCKVPWHKGIDCHDFQMLNEDERGQEDIMLVNLATNNLWKRCPNCKMYVERSQGCNVMRCRCGCSFCYACGGAFPRCHCMEGYAHRLPIGERHHAINQVRHIPPLVDIPANQTLNNPLLQFQQGPIEVNTNFSLGASLTAQRQSQRQRLQNLSANQTLNNPLLQFQQGPVEVHTNASPEASSTAQRQSRRQRLQNLSANQTQSDPSILFPQGPVGGRSNTPHIRHLAWMRLLEMNGLQNISGNHNRSDIIIQPSEASVSRTNEFRQESQSLPGTSNVAPVENLYASHSRSYTNIPPLFDSVAQTNGFIQGSQFFPVPSHVDPVENQSASETQLSGTSFASNHVWQRRQV